MKSGGKLLLALALLSVLICLPAAAAEQTIPKDAAIDTEVHKIMKQTHANGIAVAVIDHGKVLSVRAYGIRNSKEDPLTPDR